MAAGDPLRTNATITSARNNNVPLRAYIKIPGAENMDAYGAQVTTTILTNPAALWQTGDILMVLSRDGFPTPGQVTKYTISTPPVASGSGRLALWRVTVTGAVR